MSASVRLNYDRFLPVGPVPGTDFENFVLEDILDWADDTFDESTQMEITDLIELYWMCQLEGVSIEEIPAEEIQNI